MKGRNGSTSFLPSNKKGGLIKDVTSEKYLTEDQTKYIYMTKLNVEMKLELEK